MSTTRIEQTNISVEDWIDGATFVQVKHTIYRNPAMYAELAPLYEAIQAAEARIAEAAALSKAAERKADESSLGESASVAVPAGEESLGDVATPPLLVAEAIAERDKIVAQAQALYDQYDADKEVWTLRGLEPEELQAIVEAYPMPTPPKRYKKESTPRFSERVQAYVDAIAVAKDIVDEQCLALAVVDVVVKGVTKPAPTIEGIQRLRKRPHGQRHFRELVDALEAITTQEVAIPAPKSLGASSVPPASS